MLKTSIALILFFLAACAQPKTQWPKPDQAEIDAELKYQEEFLYEADFSHIHEIEPTKRAQEKRLMRIAKRVGNATMELCRELRALDSEGFKRRCLYDVDLGPYSEKSINAFADGDRIEVSRKMVQFLTKDEELAFVIAHEFAHNIMGHMRDKLNNMDAGAFAGLLLEATVQSLAGGRGYGGLGNAGAEVGAVSFSPDFEYEADYVALYILQRAGYSLTKAADVWRSLSAVSEDSLYITTTHPTSPQRYATVKRAVEEVKQKAQTGERLLPEMR
jgi:Zn-dependent protease with chaperone function